MSARTATFPYPRTFVTLMRSCSATGSMQSLSLMICTALIAQAPSVHGFMAARPAPTKRSEAILRCPSHRDRLLKPVLMSDSGGLDGLPRLPQDVYVLVKDPVEKRDKSSPLRISPIEPDECTSRLCATLQTSRRDSEGVVEGALQQLSTMPVAVEFARDRSDDSRMRTFAMPGHIAVRVRERAREQAGHGGALWGSGIGLSIFLSLNRSSLIEGRSVLELGSGVGLRCAKHMCML